MMLLSRVDVSNVDSKVSDENKDVRIACCVRTEGNDVIVRFQSFWYDLLSSPWSLRRRSGNVVRKNEDCEGDG